MSDAGMALPRAHGEPVLSARMRSIPEDFAVEELPSFEPSGSGEHLLLTVEKRGMNTAYAARLLAEWAGVQEMAIGYAGLKDRHALTVQRFSVHLPRRVAPDIALLDREGELRVLDHHWHSRKLPRGALAGNRFGLLLRDVQGAPHAIDQRLARIAEAALAVSRRRWRRDLLWLRACLPRPLRYLGSARSARPPRHTGPAVSATWYRPAPTWSCRPTASPPKATASQHAISHS